MARSRPRNRRWPGDHRPLPAAQVGLIPLLPPGPGEQDGWLADEAMVHIGRAGRDHLRRGARHGQLHEMFKLHPVGTYLVNVCTNISCQLLGAEELLEHAEEPRHPCRRHHRGRVRSPSRTSSASRPRTEAPAIQVNYRYFHNVTVDDLDQIIAEARAGTLSDRVPDHGTLGKVRQDVSADELANVTPPEQQTIRPWIARHQAAAEESA